MKVNGQYLFVKKLRIPRKNKGAAACWLQLLSEIFRTETDGLATQSESLHDVAVTLDVVLLQIVEKSAALAYKLGKSSSSTIIFTVHLQVLRQMGNTVGEQCYLALSGTSISVRLPVLSKDLLFFVRS